MIAAVLFVYGPAIEARDALEAWLRRQETEVRLPIVVRLSENKLFIGGGKLGELDVRLDDSALGISLFDRTRQACPKKDVCPLWLEGRWRPDRFSVTRVFGPFTEEEAKHPAFARVAVDSAHPELAVLIERLGSDAPIAAKQEASRALVAAGKDAIPLLIASLDDGRTYEIRDFANRMNLPVNAKVEPQLGSFTVGWRCDDLLYSIITPNVSSPHAGNFKVFSTQILRVEDWRAFWAKSKEKSLEQIHKELAPLVDAYWAAHGTTQLVR